MDGANDPNQSVFTIIMDLSEWLYSSTWSLSVRLSPEMTGEEDWSVAVSNMARTWEELIEGVPASTRTLVRNASEKNVSDVHLTAPSIDAAAEDLMLDNSSVVGAAIRVAVAWPRESWREVAKSGGSVNDDTVVACQQDYLQKVRIVRFTNIADIVNELETDKRKFYNAYKRCHVREGRKAGDCSSDATRGSREFVCLLVGHCNNKMFERVAVLIEDVGDDVLNRLPFVVDGLNLQAVRILWSEAKKSGTHAKVAGNFLLKRAHERLERERPTILSLEIDKKRRENVLNGKPAELTRAQRQSVNRNLNAKVSQARDRMRYDLGLELLKGLKQMTELLPEAIRGAAYESCMAKPLHDSSELPPPAV